MNILLLLCLAIGAETETREVIPGGATHIVHIRDWHWVKKEHYGLSQGIEGEEHDRRYEKFIAEVKAVQESQRELLKAHQSVYVEGLAPSDMPAYQEILKFQRDARDDGIATTMGAAGQLAVDGKIKVLPAEGEGFKKASPIKNGMLVIDDAAMEEREDAIVKELLKSKGKVILMLGGGHDLTDNIKRLSKDCGYTVFTPKGYPRKSAPD